MNRHASTTLLILLAIAALSTAGPSIAAERPGGVRQQPLEPPPAATSPNRSTVPIGQPPAPAGFISRRDTRMPLREPEPAESASFTHRGTRYLVSGGQWYERRGMDLVAVMPQEGVLVKNLPDGHTMRWIGGVPYFQAGGLYYVWRERPRRYEILTTPPVESAVPSHEGRSEAARDPTTP